MNFARDLDRCLKVLDWTTDDLARAMGNKFSSEYLRNIREGRPFPEVERDIFAAVTGGCSERIKSAVVDAGLSQQAAEVACREFVRVFKQFEMRLDGVANFVQEIERRVSSPLEYRMLAAEVTSSDFWNSILRGIARELTQQTIFVRDEEPEASENDFGGGLVDPIGKGVLPRTRSFDLRPETCYNCHHSTASYKTCKCPNCGLPWDIAN